MHCNSLHHDDSCYILTSYVKNQVQWVMDAGIEVLNQPLHAKAEWL